jgi:hypothetical protein
MRLSFEQVIQVVKNFGGSHLQVKKVGADFEAEMGNILTDTEKYPALFACPMPWGIGESTNTITLKIFCLDIIQKDRANIINVLSDTALILNDLFLYLTDGDDWNLETTLIGNVEPVNNASLDYLAGNSITVDIVVESYSSCEIPMGDIIGPNKECEPVTVSNSDDTYLVEVASGGVLELPDTTYKVYFNGVLQSSFSVPTLNNL